MKMLTSIFATALIVAALWAMVWAQPRQASLIKSTVQSEVTLPLSLVGVSSRANETSTEAVANQLFSQLSESPDYLNQLKDAQTFELFLIYFVDDKSQDDKHWKVSAAVSQKALKENKFQAVDIPKGSYQVLAPHGSNTNQLSDAWQKLDNNRTLKAVIESYQLDDQGNVISGHSIVSYR